MEYDEKIRQVRTFIRYIVWILNAQLAKNAYKSYSISK